MESVGALWQVANLEDCRRLESALVPNVGLSIFLTDRDCDGQRFPLLPRLQRLQSHFTELCGGYAPPVEGLGCYASQVNARSTEHTVVLTTYLPPRVSKAMRRRLLAAFVEFGRETRQELVLVVVGAFAYRLHFSPSTSGRLGHVVSAAEVA